MKIYIQRLAFSLAAALLPTLGPAQNLFVSGSPGVYEITPDGTQSLFASNLFSSSGLAFDSAGNLFVAAESASGSSSYIYKYTPGGTQSTFVSGVVNPNGLAFDSAGNLFEAEDGGVVHEFTPSGTKTTFTPGFSDAFGLAFDSAGTLFITDYDFGNICKLTSGGARVIFGTAHVPTGLAFDGSGNLFAADSYYGNIYKYAPDGTRSTFASGLSFAYGLAFDASGNLFAADSGSGNIYKYTPDGTRSTFASGLSHPGFLAFKPIPPTLGQPVKSGTQFQFLLLGSSGQNYTVQVCTDLDSMNWQPVFVTNPPVNLFLVTVPNATNESCLYRILLGP